MATTTTPTIKDLELQARADWRRWARQAARTGQHPAGRDLLHCGALLGYQHPGEVFDNDVAALQAHAVHADEIKRLQRANAANAAEYEATGKRIAELEIELDRLRGQQPLMGWSEGFALGTAEREAAAIERRHQHLFEEARETVEEAAA